MSSRTACRCTSSAGTCLVSTAPQQSGPLPAAPTALLPACVVPYPTRPCCVLPLVPHPRSDVSLIEYIRALDEQLPPAERFIITPKGGPLDDTHLLVRVGAPALSAPLLPCLDFRRDVLSRSAKMQMPNCAFAMQYAMGGARSRRLSLPHQSCSRS